MKKKAKTYGEATLRMLRAAVKSPTVDAETKERFKRQIRVLEQYVK